MFMDRNDDPTPADEGRFIPDAELAAWFKAVQSKYPQVFLPDDKLFGEYNEQHPMGQNSWRTLMMIQASQ